MNLEGKTVIVTGAGRGIGKAIALKFASLGAKVVANSTSSGADITAQEIIDSGGDAMAIKCDVRNYAGVEDLVKKTLDKYGAVDILINNAGITRDNLMMRMGETDFDDVIAVNLKGAFNCIKAVCRPMMKQRSGAIINITSVVGVIGNAGQANYAASKAGLIGLTKSVAKELAPRNITCNAIAPGFIKTRMTDQLPDTVQQEYLKAIPLARFGEAEEVANAAAFLASDMAKYITGQVLHIDGGLVM